MNRTASEQLLHLQFWKGFWVGVAVSCAILTVKNLVEYFT